MNIFIIHDVKRKSPYFEALCNALKSYKVSVIISSELIKKMQPTERSIIHFHRLGRLIGRYKNKDNIIKELNEYKKNGYELAWTVHNFIPLEMTDESEILDFESFLKDFAKCMDYIFTHTEVMKKNAVKLFDIDYISNIGYGVDFSLCSDENKGIMLIEKSQMFTYLQIGNMRDYKGIEELIDSFRILHNQGYNIRLILAGPQYKGYMENIKLAYSNVIYIDRYIYEEDYKHLIDISDVMVYPYRINMDKFKFGFYSSAIPEAAYHKKFLIVPKDDNIRCVLKDLTLCETFDVNKNDTLTRAMERVLHMSKQEISDKENALYELVSKNTWANVAQIMMNTFCDKNNIADNCCN